MAKADELAGFALLADLSDEQRASVAAVARDVSLPAGARLFDEGQVADRCWLIRSGLIALTTEVPGRGPVVIQTVGPSEVVGWSWLVPPQRWHCRAVAAEPVTAFELDAARLRIIAEQDPSLGYRLALALFGALLQRLHSTRARLLDLYGSPRDR